MPSGQPSDSPVDRWVRESLGPATVFARSLLRNRSNAEDVVHDCFCRLLRRADIYDLPNDGTKLLYRSITNACINLTQRSRSWESLDRVNSEGDARRIEPADHRTAQPDETAIGNELSVAIERGMEQLSVMQRAAIELKSLGHSLAEIADTLGLTANNAGVLVHRARQTMMEYLQPHLNATEREPKREEGKS